MSEDLKKWTKCQDSIYEILKEHSKKLDQMNEQVTLMRIEQAEHRVKIAEGRRTQATVFGLIGGAISIGVVTLVDLIFRK